MQLAEDWVSKVERRPIHRKKNWKHLKEGGACGTAASNQPDST